MPTRSHQLVDHGQYESVSEAPKPTHEHHFKSVDEMPDIEERAEKEDVEQETWWHKYSCWVWFALFLLVCLTILIMPGVAYLSGWWGN